MTMAKQRRPCAAGRGRCAGRLRHCGCLKEKILAICARAPTTTARIFRELELGAIDLYPVLFAMEFEGLIDCRKTTPWTWRITVRGEGFLRFRAGGTRPARDARRPSCDLPATAAGL